MKKDTAFIFGINMNVNIFFKAWQISKSNEP